MLLGPIGAIKLIRSADLATLAGSNDKGVFKHDPMIHPFHIPSAAAVVQQHVTVLEKLIPCAAFPDLCQLHHNCTPHHVSRFIWESVGTFYISTFYLISLAEGYTFIMVKVWSSTDLRDKMLKCKKCPIKNIVQRTDADRIFGAKHHQDYPNLLHPHVGEERTETVALVSKTQSARLDLQPFHGYYVLRMVVYT